MPRSRTLAVALALTTALALTACSSDDTASDDPAPLKPTDGPDLSDKDFTDSTGKADVAVQVRDNSYIEAYVEVSPGTTITFTNVGRTEHDVYPVVDGDFAPIEPTEMEPEDIATLTLDEPGDYAYYCTLHGTTTKGMVGAIRVVE